MIKCPLGISSYLLMLLIFPFQALESFRELQNPVSDSDTTDSELEHASFLINGPRNLVPEFKITVKKKFETSELCKIFLNKYFEFAYTALVAIHGFFACWSYATVAGSAWAVNIPFHNFGAVEKCAGDAFFGNVIPSGGCLYAYYVSLAMFALIVVTLSLLNLKEQAFVQLIFGVLRVLTLGAVLIYCIVHLSQGGGACLDELDNLTTPFNVGLRDTVLHFDIKGLVVAISVFTTALLFHIGISSLTHPIRQKKHLHWLLLCLLGFITPVCLSLGVIVSLWFQATIQENCTLNWVSQLQP